MPWTDETRNFFWLGHREIDTLNPSPILSVEKDSISPGDGSSGGDPGPERHPFAVWQIFGRRSKPHPQTILQWEFFLGLGDEKKRKNTCAHKFLFETTKTTSGSSIINTEKNAHLKLIFLPISREAVPLLSTTVFQYWPRPGSLASAVPLTSRPWMPHPKIPEGVPREIDLFLSSSNSATKTKTNRTKPNLTQPPSGLPSGRDVDVDLEEVTVTSGPWAPASAKRRPQAAGRGAPPVFQLGCSWE